MKVIRCIRNSSLAGSGMSALGCGVRQGSPADRPVLDGEVEHGPVDAAGQDAADVQQRREAEGWRPRRLLLRLRGRHDILTWMACGVEDGGEPGSLQLAYCSLTIGNGHHGIQPGNGT